MTSTLRKKEQTKTAEELKINAEHVAEAAEALRETLGALNIDVLSLYAACLITILALAKSILVYNSSPSDEAVNRATLLDMLDQALLPLRNESTEVIH